MGACSSAPSRAGPGRSESSFVTSSHIALRVGSALSPRAWRTSSRSSQSSRISVALAFPTVSPHPHFKTSAYASRNSVGSNPLICNSSFCFTSFIRFSVPLSVGSCLTTLLVVDLWSMLLHNYLIYDHCKNIPSSPRFWFYFYVVSMLCLTLPM